MPDSPSGRERALEAAAEALYRRMDFWQKPPWAEYTGYRKDDCRGAARAAVSAYLRSLVGELPEEAVEEISKGVAFDGDPEDIARAFLGALMEDH